MKLSISKLKVNLLWTAGVFSLLPVISFKARMFSWLAILMFMFVEVAFYEKIKIKKEYVFLLMLILGLLSTMTCILSDMGESWVDNAIRCYVNFSFIVLFMLLNGKGSLKKIEINRFVSGLRISCYVQLIWCYCQFLIFGINGVDITQKIFGDFFGVLKTDSVHYTIDSLSISGLAWHPAQLVPTVIISYCMFDSKIMKIIIAGVALISFNSTCIIAFGCCAGMDYMLSVLHIHKVRVTNRLIMSFFGVITVFIIVIINGTLMDLLSERILTTIERIGDVFLSDAGGYVSNSTYLHIRYYISYPQIAEYMGYTKSLFGIGFDNSGYPYSKVLGQYIGHDVWAPESDVMNILIGRGWLYFIIYYGWLISIAVRGIRICKKYFIIIVAFIISGITYNNQFEWVIVIECIIYIAIQKNINIFDNYNVKDDELIKIE